MRSEERRQPEARVPFEALVEIAAPKGASFEAESVDLSPSGMHLKTAYLPPVGTMLKFRFDPESKGASTAAQPIMVTGEVVWSQDGEGGSEFGVRFADLALNDSEAIARIVSMTTETTTSPIKPGAPVRIHIEGMTAPMRATLRDDLPRGAVVGSELKMLPLGALVELEDKETRKRRVARVDPVEVQGGSKHPRARSLSGKLPIPRNIRNSWEKNEKPQTPPKKKNPLGLHTRSAPINAVPKEKNFFVGRPTSKTPLAWKAF